MNLLNPAPQAAERDYAMRLIFQIRDVEALNDHATMDEFLASLDDYDWIIYQRYANYYKSILDGQIITEAVQLVEAVCAPYANLKLSFAEHIGPVLDMIQQAIEAFASITDLDIPPIPEGRIRLMESMIHYALAGHPYGKNHKARKRWERKVNRHE